MNKLGKYYRGLSLPTPPPSAKVTLDAVGSDVLVYANREGFSWLSAVMQAASDHHEDFAIRNIDPAELGGPLEEGSLVLSLNRFEEPT